MLGIDSAGATDSLDPATYTANYMQTVGYQWGNPPGRARRASNEVIPELAESWEPNADATQWVFKLRKGIQFSNGKEMTAADVVYSINQHRGEGSTSGAQGYLQTDRPTSRRATRTRSPSCSRPATRTCPTSSPTITS